MLKSLKTFAAREDGAITVDWVVLTGLVIGIQIVLLMIPMRNAMVDVSDSVGNKVSEYDEFLD